MSDHGSEEVRLLRLRIGEVLVAQGKLTQDQAGQAVRTGRERGIRFGEAAISLGYISDDDVAEALQQREIAVAYQRPAIRTSEIAILRDRASEAADGIRRLARTLALRWFGGANSHQALAIISADHGEGRTTLAVNLACAFALGGARTLLIDGDLENPRLHTLLVVDHEGASHAAGAGIETFPELKKNLTFIPAAALAPGGVDHLLPIPYAQIVHAYSGQFDVILVDTPPASISNDYLQAAQAAGGAIVVSRRDATRTRATVKMLNACEDLEIEIVGGTMLTF